MKLTLGKKLGLGFGSVLVLLVLGVALIYVKVGGVKDTQDRAFTLHVPTINGLTDLQRDLSQTQSKGREAVLAGNQSARWQDAKKTFDANWDAVGQDLARLDELCIRWPLPANRDRYAETKRQLPALRAAQEAAMKLAMGSERDAISKAGNQFADQATPINESIKKVLEEIVDSNDTLLQRETQGMNEAIRSMDWTMVAGASAALAIGIFVAVFLSRSISVATQAVLTQAEAIAAGDLTRVDLQIHSHDELGDLTTAINKTSASLKHMILAITEDAVQVAHAVTTVRHPVAVFRLAARADFPSMATGTKPVASHAAAIHRPNACANAPGASLANTRPNVSALGMPFSKDGRNPATATQA